MNEIILFNDTSFSQGPTNYKVDMISVNGDDTFESESGETNSNVIRQTKYKIDISYSNLTSNELNNLISLINVEKLKVDFYFGGLVSSNFKPSDKSIDMKLPEKDSYGTIANAYWNISFSLNEY